MKISALRAFKPGLTVQFLKGQISFYDSRFRLLIAVLFQLLILPNVNATTLCKKFYERNYFSSLTIDMTPKAIVEKLNFDLDRLLQKEGYDSFSIFEQAITDN
jgi:hypothetical protein